MCIEFALQCNGDKTITQRACALRVDIGEMHHSIDDGDGCNRTFDARAGISSFVGRGVLGYSPAPVPICRNTAHFYMQVSQ